jgi:surface antigen
MAVSRAARSAVLLLRWSACLAAVATAGCMSGRQESAGSAAATDSATALQRALEENVSGVAEAWHDPASGSHGSVLPTRTFRTVSGLVCRDFTVTVTVSGVTRAEDGTACRDSDGQWKNAGAAARS